MPRARLRSSLIADPADRTLRLVRDSGLVSTLAGGRRGPFGDQEHFRQQSGQSTPHAMGGGDAGTEQDERLLVLDGYGIRGVCHDQAFTFWLTLPCADRFAKDRDRPLAYTVEFREEDGSLCATVLGLAGPLPVAITGRFKKLGTGTVRVRHETPGGSWAGFEHTVQVKAGDKP